MREFAHKLSQISEVKEFIGLLIRDEKVGGTFIARTAAEVMREMGTLPPPRSQVTLESNGEPIREGDEIAPGVRVESIQVKV